MLHSFNIAVDVVFVKVSEHVTKDDVLRPLEASNTTIGAAPHQYNTMFVAVPSFTSMDIVIVPFAGHVYSVWKCLSRALKIAEKEVIYLSVPNDSRCFLSRVLYCFALLSTTILKHLLPSFSLSKHADQTQPFQQT